MWWSFVLVEVVIHFSITYFNFQRSFELKVNNKNNKSNTSNQLRSLINDKTKNNSIRCKLKL